MIGRRLVLALAAAAPALAQAPRRPLVAAGKRSLPRRVLLRPGATLHAMPGAGAGEPGLGFAAFYVYAESPGSDGPWLEIGAGMDGRTEGWVAAARTLAWDHGMVAAFTNPAGRGRGVFLESAELARGLVFGDGPARLAALRADAEAGRPAPGVLALEPVPFVDMARQFYLLPILSAATVDRETGGSVRVLETVSVPADPPPAPPPPDPLAGFRAGLVFVVDTTLSMQPYIDRTREAMEAVVARLGETAVRDNFRFGVVGFRDSKQATPAGYEYTAQVFARPDFSAPPDAALEAMRAVRAATGDNEGFDEDAVAGLKLALDDIDWNALGGRYLVLITDAGAREGDDPLASNPNLGIEQIRQEARARGVTVFAIHLLTAQGRASGNHARARGQYTRLTGTDGRTEPLYYPVENAAPAEFRSLVGDLTESILLRVAEATGTPVEALRGAGAAPRSGQAERIERQVRVVAEAMRLAWLGRERGTTAPEVIRSFILDRDPAPPGVPVVDVRVLLTRNQLNDLSSVLTEILRAGRSARLAPEDFFGQLRSALALAARDPTRIAAAGSLGGLLGEFLDGLPYQSELMGMTEDTWLAMGAGAQAHLLNGIDARLRLYQDFSANAALWTTLGGRSDAGEQVFPVPLDALP